jgi:hypothetical protein
MAPLQINEVKPMTSAHDSDHDAIFGKDLRVYSSPTPPDFCALCAELLDELQALRLAVAYEVGCPLPEPPVVLRARAALEAQPEPEGVTDEDWRHELNGRLWDSYKTIGYQGKEFMYDSDFDIAFDAIYDAFLQRYARPAIQPVAPTDEEILASVRHFYGDQTAADMGAEDDLRTARAVLARWGTPANNTNQED